MLGTKHWWPLTSTVWTLTKHVSQHFWSDMRASKWWEVLLVSLELNWWHRFIKSRKSSLRTFKKWPNKHGCLETHPCVCMLRDTSFCPDRLKLDLNNTSVSEKQSFSEEKNTESPSVDPGVKRRSVSVEEHGEHKNTFFSATALASRDFSKEENRQKCFSLIFSKRNDTTACLLTNAVPHRGKNKW